MIVSCAVKQVSVKGVWELDPRSVESTATKPLDSFSGMQECIPGVLNGG